MRGRTPLETRNSNSESRAPGRDVLLFPNWAIIHETKTNVAVRYKIPPTVSQYLALYFYALLSPRLSATFLPTTNDPRRLFVFRSHNATFER